MDKPKIESLFRYNHLPEELQAISKPFHDMALDLIKNIRPCPELTLSIRTLWESKNLAVFSYTSSKD